MNVKTILKSRVKNALAARVTEICVHSIEVHFWTDRNGRGYHGDAICTLCGVAIEIKEIS